MAIRKVKPVDIKIRPSSDSGIFHDSRGDVRILTQAINTLIEKQNEVIETVNRLIDLQEKG